MTPLKGERCGRPLAGGTLWITLLAAGLMDFAAAAAFLAVPLMALDRGASSWQLGAIGALVSGAHGGSALIVARFVGAAMLRLRLVLMPLVLGATYLSAVTLPGVGVLLGVAAIAGVCFGTYWTAMEVRVAEVRGGLTLGGAVARFNVVWASGMLLGHLAGGVLYEWECRVVMGVAAMAMVIVAFLLGLTAVEGRGDLDDAEGESAALEAPSARAKRLAAWTASLSASAAVGCVRYLFPELAQSLDIMPAKIGGLLGVMSAIQLAFFVVGLALGEALRRCAFSGLLVGLVMAAVAMAVIATGDRAAFFGGAFVVLGLVAATTYYASLVASLGGRDPGGYVGVHEATLGLGRFVGPFVGGLAAEELGLRAPYILCALGFAGAFAVTLWSWRKRAP